MFGGSRWVGRWRSRGGDRLRRGEWEGGVALLGRSGRSVEGVRNEGAGNGGEDVVREGFMEDRRGRRLECNYLRRNDEAGDFWYGWGGGGFWGGLFTLWGRGPRFFWGSFSG